MYGLSKETDLSFLVGKQIIQVALGLYDVQLNWRGGGISIWSKFTFGPAGSSDHIVWTQGNPEAACCTAGLLRTTIAGAECTAEGTLLVRFSDGSLLELFEDPLYESFSINDKNRLGILI